MSHLCGMAYTALDLLKVRGCSLLVYMSPWICPHLFGCGVLRLGPWGYRSRLMRVYW